jgi:hypothetical protein
MNTKNSLSWMLLLFGEAIIITAFILFKRNTPDNILVLNIVVGSLVYWLVFLNFRAPWIDLNDKSQKRVGAISVSWLITWLYAILAIATIVCGHFVSELTFTIQLIIQCGLIFLLLWGLFGAQHASDKVKQVYEQEAQNRSGISEMKSAMRQLKDKMSETNGLPESFTNRINSLEENLRFMSPSNSVEVYNLERSFTTAAGDITFAISDFLMNEERIETNLKKLERICQNRKNSYSH